MVNYECGKILSIKDNRTDIYIYTGIGRQINLSYNINQRAGG